MIRKLILGCALLLTAIMGYGLVSDAAYVIGARKSTAELLGAEGGQGAVVMVFNRRDCSASGDLLARWDRRFRAAAYRVDALMVEEVTPFRRDSGTDMEALSLPVRSLRHRDAAIVAERLGYRSTPFAVVLDAHGRVVASFPAGQEVPDDIIIGMIGRETGDVRAGL